MPAPADPRLDPQLDPHRDPHTDAAGDWWAEGDWDGWTDREDEVWEYEDWDGPGEELEEGPVGGADRRAAAPVRGRGAGRVGGGRSRADDEELYDLDDEDDHEAFPRAPRRWTGLVTALVVLLVLAGVVLSGLRWVRHRIDPPGPPGEQVAVVVPKGYSTAKIGDLLAQNGVITDARLFRYYVRIKGKGGFEAGKYELRQNSSFDEALAQLAEGPSVPDEVRLTVPEGLRIEQVADKVGTLPERTAARFLEAAKSGTVHSQFQPDGSSNLEGLVFPETYSIGATEDEEAILTRMVQTFDQVAGDEGIADAQQSVGVTPYQAIIVASLVEREARVPEDRAKIARVIYNRLNKGMPLQIDATVIYALGGNRDRVLYKDLQVDSAYNTYKNKGLPPTPIASPGKASMDAALHPADGDWLYYVVTGEDGSHSFATTLAEHRRNIALAQKKGLR